MKTYTGTRDRDRGAIVRVAIDGKAPRALRLRLDLDSHSPTGFEWGYPGSGPAQLALALLADALGDDARACRLHQQFKWAVIAKLKHDDPWEMTDADVREHADALERQNA